MSSHLTQALLIANAFPPENLTGATRPYHFARYLREYGYEPIVIAGVCPDEPFVSPAVYRVPAPDQRGFALNAAAAVMKCLRRVSPYEDRLSWIPYVVARGARMFASRPISVVFSTSPPISGHLAALELKRRFGIKWVADFRDPLVKNPFRSSARAAWCDAVVERLIFRHADAVIANTDTALENWRCQYPQWHKKMHLIWNGFDSLDAIPVSRHKPGPRIVAHIGSIYGDRNPEQFLTALDRLQTSRALSADSVIVRLVGTFDLGRATLEREPYSSLIARGCLECTETAVAREAAQVTLAEADSLLLLDNGHRGVPLQVPAKLFEYIRTGKPVLVLTQRDAPCLRILERSGVPHVCIFPDSDETASQEMVLRFLALQRPSPPQEWFNRTFDAKNRTQALAMIFDSLIGSKSRSQEASISA
jgi:hypothetical protein